MQSGCCSSGKTDDVSGDKGGEPGGGRPAMQRGKEETPEQVCVCESKAFPSKHVLEDGPRILKKMELSSGQEGGIGGGGR